MNKTSVMRSLPFALPRSSESASTIAGSHAIEPARAGHRLNGMKRPIRFHPIEAMPSFRREETMAKT